MVDAYLPVTVYDVPAAFVFDGASVRERFRHYLDQGVLRVIAGPMTCHVIIDIRRPYRRPRYQHLIEAAE